VNYDAIQPPTDAVNELPRGIGAWLYFNMLATHSESGVVPDPADPDARLKIEKGIANQTDRPLGEVTQYDKQIAQFMGQLRESIIKEESN
jgi:hypothetical protein